MLIDVEAFFLDTRFNTQAVELLDAEEEQDAADSRPEVDDHDAQTLYAEEVPAATIKETAIGPETMAVEQNNVCPIEAETAATAYGELLQQTIFFDENDNLYIAAFSDTTIEEGKLLRIKNGEFNIDASFNGFPNSDGKLLTVQYLGNGKVFAYSRHDDSTLGTSIDSYAHYYSVIDLNTLTRTRMAFNGTEIPYSSGRFSQRSAFNAAENKVYFGVNTETAQPQIYIYDVATGAVTAGAKIKEGYYFEQIRIVED